MCGHYVEYFAERCPNVRLGVGITEPDDVEELLLLMVEPIETEASTPVLMLGSTVDATSVGSSSGIVGK